MALELAAHLHEVSLAFPLYTFLAKYVDTLWQTLLGLGLIHGVLVNHDQWQAQEVMSHLIALVKLPIYEALFSSLTLREALALSF